MEFEWDEIKRQANIHKHRVDFQYAALIFENFTLTRIDDRDRYGEVRKISIRLVDGECFVVVHTQRGENIRLISAWKGGRDERSAYPASLARRTQEDEGAG